MESPVLRPETINKLIFAAHSAFAMLAGMQLDVFTPIEELSLYQWHTKTAKDYFCPNCGIFPFRRPRTTEDVWSINVRCLEGVDLSSIPIKQIYGSRLD
jgi:hypothetical protein